MTNSEHKLLAVYNVIIAAQKAESFFKVKERAIVDGFQFVLNEYRNNTLFYNAHAMITQAFPSHKDERDEARAELQKQLDRNDGLERRIEDLEKEISSIKDVDASTLRKERIERYIEKTIRISPKEFYSGRSNLIDLIASIFSLTKATAANEIEIIVKSKDNKIVEVDLGSDGKRYILI